MGLLKPRAGQVMFNGEDITDRSPSYRARAGLGYVPQGRGIFPYLTVYENLVLGLEALNDKREGAAAIEEMYALFPVIKQMRARVAGTLSGGQQQQLAIARALVRRPTLLLLDEPTEGIQPSLVLEIEQVLLALGRSGSMAILLVEQFLDFALRVADSYYIMEKGAIVSHGAAAECDQEVVREYLAV